MQGGSVALGGEWVKWNLTHSPPIVPYPRSKTRKEERADRKTCHAQATKLYDNKNFM